MVQAKTVFSWGVFLILMCCCGLGICYLIYFCFKKPTCPMCNSTNWGVKPQQAPFTQVQPTVEEFKYCSQCGEKIGSTVQFCSLCGAKQF